MTKRFFTTIELIVTIGIILLLSTIVLATVSAAAKHADTAKTKAKMEEFKLAIDKFKHDNGYYPVAQSTYQIHFYLKDSVFTMGLGSSSSETNSFKFSNKQGKPYIDFQPAASYGADDAVFIDAWGNAFNYKCPGSHNKQSYDLWSNGADGNTSTDDDNLNNW